MTKRRVVAFVVVLVVLSLLAIGGVSYKASSTLLSPESNPFSPPPPNTPVDVVEMHAADGVGLAGWYVRPRCAVELTCSSFPGVVLAPGRGATRAAFNDEISQFYDSGFATLTFDFRATGRSDRNVYSTAGANEQLDLDAAVSYLAGQQGVRPGVAVYGKSQGAATAVLASADNDNVSAVVDEAGFSSLSDVVDYNFKTETGLPAFPFAPLSVKIAEYRGNVSLDEVEPVKVVGQISPRPLLVVHARGDQRVRYEESEKIFRAAGEPKKFWTLDGPTHAESIVADPEGWRLNVLGFLQQWAQDQQSQQPSVDR